MAGREDGNRGAVVENKLFGGNDYSMSVPGVTQVILKQSTCWGEHAPIEDDRRLN